MDAFFAAIEERNNPQFAGLGIVVGADPKNGIGRGVVSTANYQARKYGIHSAMPISQAFRLAQAALKRGNPETIFLPVNGAYYSRVSQKIMEIIQRYVPLVEQTSIDEAYLDLTFCADEREKHNVILVSEERAHPGSLWDSGQARMTITADYNKAIDLINKIKAEIASQEKLTATVGLGSSKLIAKMASAKNKPDGLTVVIPAEVEKFLDPLPIGDIPGIGPKTEEFFHQKKIFKVADLKKISREQLISWLGKWGADLYQKAKGIDDSAVETEREAKSISEQETFEEDTLSGSFLIEKLNKMVERVLERMRNEDIKGFKTVTVTVRFFDFQTISRSHTLGEFTDKLSILKMEALKLFLPFLDRRENPKLKPIRLIGVGVENLKRIEEESIQKR
jgi:DNA polymerase IV (DinB-like DNA polymerase)